ncbi:GlsB/YeaQ/YmgE family stress response membrane protein [Georgenia faecalis]|uniref:GlsB/YeaQ/YmgE family stress response membrane protein n=1 Tax=Georgenia faecalis TaxID=2483799 RepID=A0ABV9DD20_9MICO|nr:GlsB/YeaQ/YmgE family stress response membrane protein [Georgenia faecalis]
MGELIGIIIFGAVIGALARLFMKGDQNLGIIWTIILGVLGALVGQWLAGLFGVEDTNGIDWIRWIFSIVASILFISIYLGITNKNRSTRR